ncbi:MAG: hypothetical protein HZB59_06640 [Ignavibacteriales bacterium]|nr:hypothetical protein [Ignavibacteriales bacterium]
MKISLLILSTFILYNSLHAQVAEPAQTTEAIEQSVFGVGLAGGLASGFGLSFRHHLPGDFSYQIIGGVIKADNQTLLNVGTELQYDFVRGETTRFFGAGALGYFYRGRSENQLSAPIRFGLGIGGELNKLEPLHLSGELLFTFFNDGTILPLPQIALHYYFF